MSTPPFIKQATSVDINNDTTKQSGNGKKSKSTLVLNPSMQPYFKNGMGERLLKAAYDNKDYPEHIPNQGIIYLDYQLKGRYYREEGCRHTISY